MLRLVCARPSKPTEEDSAVTPRRKGKYYKRPKPTEEDSAVTPRRKGTDHIRRAH